MHKLIHDLWRKNNLTILMLTNNIKEEFSLGSRLRGFDKVCHDPQAPNAYGAQITFDLSINAEDCKVAAKTTINNMENT